MRACVLALVLLAGCIGADEDVPHTLVLENYGPAAVEGRMRVLHHDDLLLDTAFALPAGGDPETPRSEARFGPAAAEGMFFVTVELSNGTRWTDEARMAKGGWYLYVAMSEGRFALSTLHGD